MPDSDLEKKRDHLPRKCAVIRRTYPEPGVRKTELRFVSYKRPGGDMDVRLSSEKYNDENLGERIFRGSEPVSKGADGRHGEEGEGCAGHTEKGQ